MKEWVLSQEGDQWSVKFDVRDVGGHLGTTFRGWSLTLAALLFLWISMIGRVVRSVFLPAALYRIEASFLASDSLWRLRSSIRMVVWSRRQPLAGVGAVLSLLHGPTGCDPAFCVVWFRFRLLRRYLALWPAEVGRVYRLLAMVGEGCLGHGSVHFLSASAAEMGFNGILMPWLGLGLGYLCLVIWLALFSISRLLFLMPGVTRLLLIFAGGMVFVVVLFWRSMVLCSSLILLMFAREIRLCFVALWWVVSGMVCFLVGCEVRRFLVGSVVLLTMMVIYFGNVFFLLLLRYLKILSFMIS